MIIILEKNQKILSQLEMTSCSCVVCLPDSLSFSDILVFHITRYLPPPATSQRVLRGDITVTMEELMSKHSRDCPYATGNNALEIFISSFLPTPSTPSNRLFLSSYPTSPHHPDSISSSVELKIHVMDGLNYPLKQKTNVIVQFDLLTFQRDSLDAESNSVTEIIISTIQTNESIHPRQLLWDHKLSLSLPTKIVHNAYHKLFPSDTRISNDSERYHLKISLIQVSGSDDQSSPRASSSNSPRQVQAMVIKDLSEILKPLFFTNSSLLASKPSLSLSSKRHEIVLPLPFEPHLLLNSSFSSASSDPSVRLRIGLLLVESSKAENETKSLAQARVLERFDQKSG